MSIRTSSGLKRRGGGGRLWRRRLREEEEEGFPSSSSSSRRRTATVAAEVCCLPLDSVAGTRCTLWTPASFLRLSATPRPFTLAAASLMPPPPSFEAEEEEEGAPELEDAPAEESRRSSRHSQPAEAE